MKLIMPMTLRHMLLVAFCLFPPSAVFAAVFAGVSFDAHEQRVIQSLSGHRFKVAADPTNRVSGKAEAIALGRSLFFDNRLSGSGSHSCASCHNPADSFSSAHIQGNNNAPLAKHTPHLWNVAANRWYFWDGRTDSLWAQALEPIENEHEMAGSRVAVARLMRDDADYLRQYEALFERLPVEIQGNDLPEQAKPLPDNKTHPAHRAWSNLPAQTQQAVDEVFVNAAKAIAAFEETIVSNNSAFDQFAVALAEQSDSKQATAGQNTLSQPALRGLKLFTGKAACVRCHSGPNFSDAEFHQLFLDKASEPLNAGRYQGIDRLRNNPFNSKSRHSDAPKHHRHAIDYVYRHVEFRGQYKTPSLRNVAKTAPYMHNGQFQTLADVIDYYNTISERVKPGNHQETTLKSLHLSASEKQDLEAFLLSLTDESYLQQLNEVRP